MVRGLVHRSDTVLIIIVGEVLITILREGVLTTLLKEAQTTVEGAPTMAEGAPTTGRGALTTVIVATGGLAVEAGTATKQTHKPACLSDIACTYSLLYWCTPGHLWPPHYVIRKMR